MPSEKYYKVRIEALHKNTILPIEVCKEIVKDYYMNPSVYVISKFMRKLMITLKNYRKLKSSMYDMNRDANGIVRNILILEMGEERNPLGAFYRTFDDYSSLCDCELCSGFESKKCVVKKLLLNRLLPYFQDMDSNEGISYDIYISYINMLLQGKKKKVKKIMMKMAKLCVSMGVLL